MGNEHEKKQRKTVSCWKDFLIMWNCRITSGCAIADHRALFLCLVDYSALNAHKHYWDHFDDFKKQLIRRLL